MTEKQQDLKLVSGAFALLVFNFQDKNPEESGQNLIILTSNRKK